MDPPDPLGWESAVGVMWYADYMLGILYLCPAWGSAVKLKKE